MHDYDHKTLIINYIVLQWKTLNYAGHLLTKSNNLSSKCIQNIVESDNSY